MQKCWRPGATRHWNDDAAENRLAHDHTYARSRELVRFLARPIYEYENNAAVQPNHVLGVEAVAMQRVARAFLA